MTILLLILAYLIGSIPSALIIGKLFYKMDIREHGSGNLGATNTFRILGKKAGFIVTVLDVLKGTVAVLLPVFFGVDAPPQLLLGLLAAFGHVFPIFAGFKGGKAVATSAGIALGYAPIMFGIMAIVFFSSLKLSKYVSLSSLIAAFTAVVYSIIKNVWFDKDWQLLVGSLLIFGFITYKHRANLERIRNHSEPKVSWI